MTPPTEGSAAPRLCSTLARARSFAYLVYILGVGGWTERRKGWRDEARSARREGVASVSVSLIARRDRVAGWARASYTFLLLRRHYAIVTLRVRSCACGSLSLSLDPSPLPFFSLYDPTRVGIILWYFPRGQVEVVPLQLAVSSFLLTDRRLIGICFRSSFNFGIVRV